MKNIIKIKVCNYNNQYRKQIQELVNYIIMKTKSKKQLKIKKTIKLLYVRIRIMIRLEELKVKTTISFIKNQNKN